MAGDDPAAVPAAATPLRRLWHHAPTFVPGQQGAVDWAMQHAAAVAQSEMVTSPAVTTAVCPGPSTVTVAVQTPVSGNR